MAVRGDKKTVNVKYRREPDGTYSVICVIEVVEIDYIHTIEEAKQEVEAIRRNL